MEHKKIIIKKPRQQPQRFGIDEHDDHCVIGALLSREVEQAEHDTFIEGEHKRGKEPFNFEKFAKNYLHDRGSCQSLSPNESPYVIAQYKEEYYDHPEILTVVDFANYLDEMDSHS